MLTTLGQIFSDHVKHHPHWALAFGVFAFMMIVLPIADSAVKLLRGHSSPKNDTPLEIIFEPLNPARRFWSMESHFDDYKRLVGTFWEHRVEVKNTSSVTLRNVKVTVERTGPLPQPPQQSAFTRTKTDLCDINPGCSELVLVTRWPVPKRQVGMLSSDSAWGYGPIEVTASADNVPPAKVVFDFNYETDQMLFERGKY